MHGADRRNRLERARSSFEAGHFTRHAHDRATEARRTRGELDRLLQERESLRRERDEAREQARIAQERGDTTAQMFREIVRLLAQMNAAQLAPATRNPLYDLLPDLDDEDAPVSKAALPKDLFSAVVSSDDD